MSNLDRKRVMGRRSRHRRARYRLRNQIAGTSERPRLAVHKSLRYIYAQVINDQTGETLAHASSLEKDVRSSLDAGPATKLAAKVVGQTVAQRAKERGVDRVVFDRGGYVYHGRVRELAEGARGAGLDF